MKRIPNRSAVDRGAGAEEVTVVDRGMEEAAIVAATDHADQAGSKESDFLWGRFPSPPTPSQEGPMVTRAQITFQKRQKELARKEKRQMKEERRAQRKLANEGGDMSEEAISPSELEPEGGSRAT